MYGLCLAQEEGDVAVAGAVDLQLQGLAARIEPASRFVPSRGAIQVGIEEGAQSELAGQAGRQPCQQHQARVEVDRRAVRRREAGAVQAVGALVLFRSRHGVVRWRPRELR
jgi:hypothetical protein